MLRFADDLDPTHQRRMDIAHAELKAEGIEVNAWIALCGAFWMKPCDCQEGICEEIRR
jgi:hypothetical protein